DLIRVRRERAPILRSGWAFYSGRLPRKLTVRRPRDSSADVRSGQIPKGRTCSRRDHAWRPEQLQYAGHTARVVRSMMYHGGDILYELDGIPGIWHEACVEAI